MTDIVDTSYSKVLEEIGAQFRLRGRALLMRSILIAIPVFLVVVYYANNPDALGRGAPTYDADINTLLKTLAVLCFVLLYSTIFGAYVALEKRLWVDSYFDGRALTSKESGRMALKLMPQAFILSLTIFIFYILSAFVVFVAMYSFLLIKMVDSNINSAVYFTIFVIPPLVLALYYKYYLPVKLRFVWFLFLDRYKPKTLVYWGIFREVKALNKTGKSEQVIKSLAYKIGSDVTGDIASVVLSRMHMGASALGRVGSFLGGLLRVTGETYSRQMLSFARITANYLLYREARMVLFGASQVVNEELYNIIK